MGMGRERLEWAQSNTQIFQPRPNAKHFEIHENYASGQAMLSDVPKAKSLVVFSITTRQIESTGYMVSGFWMLEDVDAIALARNSLRRPRAQAIGAIENLYLAGRWLGNCAPRFGL